MTEAPGPGVSRRSAARSVIDILFKDSVFLILSKTAFKVFLLLFMLILARYLSQEDFGDFQFVSGLINLITQPLVILAMIVTKIGNSFPQDTQRENLLWLYNKFRLPWLALIAATVIGFWALDSWMIEMARVEANGSFMAGLVIISAVLFQYYIGYLQVLEYFKTIGAAYIVMGAATVLFGVMIYLFDLGILTAYGAQALAGVVAVFMCLWVMISAFPAREIKGEGNRFQTAKYSVKVMLVMVVFFAMYNMDILSVKLLFDRAEAGYYLRMEFLGKMSFVVASSIAVIVFSRTSKKVAAGEDPIAHLLKGSGIYMAISIVILITAFAWYGGLYTLIFGEDIKPDIKLMSAILIARLLQSYYYILLTYASPTVSRWTVLVVGFPFALQVVLFAVNNSAPINLAMNALAAALMGVVAILIYITAKRRMLIGMAAGIADGEGR